MALTSVRLAKAGWLAVANAIVTVPLFLFSFMLALDDSHGARAVQTILTLISTLLFIYIMLTLLDYLNSSHQFHDVDMLVKLLLWMNIAVTVLSMLGLLSQPLREAGGLFAIILIVPSGVTQAVFGYRLLRLPGLTGTRFKPYGVLNVITGVCFALVVPIPIGLLTSVAADVILGKVLLEAAEKQPLS
ncbi:hypothetical protein [Geotalea toluenoxydans]|uniref:hypothetical protein n=1 Tax=Geotalea toluenoxydans TaxID=421624 RepID=UPI0006D1DE9B|nr:hypothetical protein [Geotalea toluenoxydans]